MNRNPEFTVISIYEFLGSDEGEKIFGILAGSFSSKNSEIESFFKYSALDFAKRKQAVTYLIFKGKAFVAYFSLALKTLAIDNNLISKTTAKKLARLCTLDDNFYRPPAYLIAQLGKNFADDNHKKITGDEIIAIIMETIQSIQYLIGGVVTFLECEDNDKLLSFYKRNKFAELGVRLADSADVYVQLYKMI